MCAGTSNRGVTVPGLSGTLLAADLGKDTERKVGSQYDGGDR